VAGELHDGHQRVRARGDGSTRHELE
jgi:hypothetical protein